MLAVILVLALVAIPVVFLRGHSEGATGESAFQGRGQESQATENSTRLTAVEETRPAVEEPGDDTGLESFIRNSTGSQVTYHRLSDGFHTGTATERFARPALSLIKLYIADYVLKHGTLAEQYEAVAMISSSDDASAEELYERYPEAIEATAREYGLLSTRGDERWGYSVTSTYDVAKFIAQLLEDDPTSPILVAMAQASPVAADGYGQDFGTSELPGVIGTKWGWSDDRQLHSSVSFGEDFVVAAAVTGSADDLTRLVENQLTDVVEEGEESED